KKIREGLQVALVIVSNDQALSLDAHRALLQACAADHSGVGARAPRPHGRWAIGYKPCTLDRASYPGSETLVLLKRVSASFPAHRAEPGALFGYGAAGMASSHGSRRLNTQCCAPIGRPMPRLKPSISAPAFYTGPTQRQ